MVDERTKEYLLKLMKRCEKYDVFSENLEIFDDVEKVRLQDVYTMPHVLSYRETEVIRAPHSMSLLQDEISQVLANDKMHEKKERETDKNPCAEKYRTIIYSYPQCGKTSFVRIYSLLCAYRALGASAVEDTSLERLLSQDLIRKSFRINEGAVPVILDMYSIYRAVKRGNKDVLKDVIIHAIKEVVKERTDAEQIYRNNEIALVIEDIDKYKFGKWIFEELKTFLDKEEEKITSVILTASSFDIDELCGSMEKLKFEQYFLPELQRGRTSVEWMIAFARQWYKGLNDKCERKLDVETNFLLPFSRNAEAISRIKNPKELTDLLLVSVYDSCLPSDVISVENRFREIKLEREKLDEVVISLAKAAYELLDSGKGYITEERLKWYLLGGIEGIQPGASDLIERLGRIGIIGKRIFFQGYAYSHGVKVKRLSGETGNNYYFPDEKDEAYFVAYAVKHNLMKDETKKTRFDYIKDKIANKDNAWRDSIICLAVIDGKLQAEIINELLELAKEEENDSYYADLLLEMRINPGIDFLFPETKLIFELLNKQCNWKLFDRECDKIERLARQCSQKECEQWVVTLLDGYQAINDPLYRNTYVKYVKATLVFCAEQCGMEDKIKGIGTIC